MSHGATAPDASRTAFAGARVLFVSSSYPFHRADFHALFVHEMARALVDAGARVRVLTPQTPEGGADEEEWEGVEVTRFRYAGLRHAPLTGGEGMVENTRARPWRALSAPGLMAAFVSSTRAHGRDFRPDLVVSHWLVPSGLAVALARLRCPTLHVAHSSDVHLLARLPFGGAVGRVLSSSGQVLATSEALAERLRRARVVAHPFVWRLPVVLPTPPAARRRRGAPLEVVAMSRLIDGKGLFTLVRAAAAVPDVRLRIAGSGPLAARLAREIERLGLGGRASLVGAVLGVEKRALLERADLFAFVPEPKPGAFEDNLPVSVVEAMAYGVPVMATAVGHLPRLLAHGGGVLVEPDVASVTAALAKLTDADREALSRRARAAAEPFSRERSLDALASLFGEQRRLAARVPHRAGRAG